MNIRRFAIVALVLGLVLAAGSWYATRCVKQCRASETANATATTQPDSSAVKAPEAKPATSAPVATSGPVVAGTTQKVSNWQDKRASKGEKLVLGSLDEMPADGSEGYLFQVELLPDGAAINTVKLHKYFQTVEDKKLAETDMEAYRKALRDKPKKYKGYYSVLNPIRSGSTATGKEGKVHTQGRVLPLATHSIKMRLADMSEARTWDPDSWPWRVEPRQKDASGDTESVAFSWTLVRDGVDVLKLTKTYTIRKADYTIDVSLKVENLTQMGMEVTIDQYGPTGVPREGHREDARRAVYGAIKNDDGQKVQTLAEARKGKLDDAALGERKELGSSSASEPVLWVGQDNKFFGSMMYIVPEKSKDENDKNLTAVSLKAGFYMQDVLETDTSATQMTGITIPELSLEAGGSRTVKFALFCGPKRREMFFDDGADYFKPLYKNLDYAGTIQLRSCFCGWDALSLAMIWLLRVISNVTFGNFGIAIFILVIIVRLVLHPLTKKSQVAMAKMKTLGPMMKELEKKYADDKEALNRERIRMYKQQGATPLLGCLPMLLQMPILIALYTGINASIDLRHAAFLPVWIVDLAAPDRLFEWADSLPLIGTEFNLLPFLLGAAMYWQMKLSPQSNQVGATPEQQKQQKMMGMMMPVMMLFIFYHMNSGLTLYFLSSTFFGAMESHVIRKHIETKEALAAATETTVQMPGKGPRTARPKKPKGPNYIKRG